MIKSKKQMFIILGIFTLILMLGQVTYAAYTYSRVGTSNSKFISGDIYMKYNETSGLTLENAVPRSSYIANKYFEFQIIGKNTNTEKDIYYDITLDHGSIPIYSDYSETEIKKVITFIINKSVSEVSIGDNLFILNKESNGLTIVDYDPVIVNKIMGSISDNVYNNLKLIEKMDNNVLEKYNISKSVFYIPSGLIFDSVFLNNLGPKIQIKLELIGSVNPSIETKVTEYGINNSLIEVNIKISTFVRSILPLSSKELNIIVMVPLTVKIIQGNIPEYYFGPLYEKKK